MVGQGLTRYHQGPFCIWDAEGESLHLRFSRPWQVAWAYTDLKQVHWVKSRFIYWKDLAVSRESAIITRFDPAKYKASARPAREVLDEFLTDLNRPDVRPVFQNGLGYDVYAKAAWERGCGVKPDYAYLLRTIDTNPLLKAHIKGWTPDISSPEAFLAWQYKGSAYVERGLKTNLTDVGKARKIEHDYAHTHDAANDVVLLWKILKELVYQVEF